MQEEIVRNYSRDSDDPLMVIGHTAFIDYRKFGLQNPTYFSLVRDPIDRLVSLWVLKIQLRELRENLNVFSQMYILL